MTACLRPALLAAALAVLSGCNREAQRPAPAPAAPAAAPPVAPASAPAPLAYESKTPFAEVKLTLPAAVKAYPDLHARLYAAGVRDLRQFTEGAQADRTEYGGDQNMPAYQKTIDWRLAGQTGKLVSLRSQTYDFSGGAHPNAAFGAALWDKALQRAVEAAGLFRPGVDLTPLDRALCEAINVAKRKRSPQSTPVRLGDASGNACPRAVETPFVLAASTIPGKAGGLSFLISPYLVGPYAEGSYEIVLPQSLFRTLLAPAYADEFAGQPPKTGDVS